MSSPSFIDVLRSFVLNHRAGVLVGTVAFIALSRYAVKYYLASQQQSIEGRGVDPKSASLTGMSFISVLMVHKKTVFIV